MKITTLMDDQPSSSFKNEHGLSFYIQAHNTNILFDTGASSLYLENARKLSLPIEEVDTLIISHGHYDHTGGLSDFLKSIRTQRSICKRMLYCHIIMMKNILASILL